MSRPLRIEYKDAWYHVMNRGRRAEAIFTSKDDYTRFIDLLKEPAELWNVRVGAYCLMENHYHLLVQTPDANISRCMRHINGIYTQHHTRVQPTDGALFRGRDTAILVDADASLLQLTNFIHRNPVEVRGRLPTGLIKRGREFFPYHFETVGKSIPLPLFASPY